jgi:hypothetical protein
MKQFWRMATVLLVASLAGAQTTTTTKKVTKKSATRKASAPKKATTAEELQALRIKMQAQQDQIDALKSTIADKDGQVAAAAQATATAQQSASAAQAKADTAAATSQAAQDQVNALSSTVTDLKATDQGLQETVISNQARIREEIDSPASIRYKGITITPVAFFAFEGVWRQHSVNSDINTPFNSIPFPSADEGHVSELNFSGRQSRLGALFEGNAGNFKLSGYAEMDFLGTGTSSNNNQSNSYVLRQRQIWGKAETTGGFAVTGGQMWSLVTENGVSTNARTEKLPNTIDPQYMVGFSWTRQPGIRFQQRFGDVKTGAFTVAMSLEQAQITNFTANGTNPTNYFFAGPGQNGGLYNAAAGAGAGNTTPSGAITTYANNVAPDVAIKGAVDVPHAHFELGGLARFLRDYYNPITGYTGTASAPTYTYDLTQQLSHTAVAGGVFGSARVSPSKFVDVALQLMAGTGVGRYGSSQLADATLRPDETLEPIKNYHGMFSLETHPTPKLDVFAYYGGEYAQRTVYTTPQGNLIGYGPRNLSNAGCYNIPAPDATPGSGGSLSATPCGSPTRYIQEDMIGFTYRVANSPKYGRLQYSATYSYLQRNLWSGVGSATTPSGPRALDGMIHVGMRYYIP